MIDYTKPVETKDGHEVEVYSTDNGGDYPVHIKYKNDDGFWYPDSRTLDGKAYKSSNDLKDLIQKKEKKTLWVNVYKDGLRLYTGLSIYYTKNGAFECIAGDNCVGTYPITIEV